MPSNNDDVVWVDVLPTLKGFSPLLRAGLKGASAEASASGSAAGRAFGMSFGTSAAAAVESASAKVAAAQKRAADAAGRLTVAQSRLTEVYNSGTASASKVAAAEEAVAKAQRNVTLTTDAATAAEKQQVRVQAEVSAASTRAAEKQAALSARTAETGVVSRALNSTLGSVKGTLGGVATAMTGLPALAVGAFLYEAAKQATSFNKSMLLVQTQAGASAAEVAAMKPAILSLSGKVAQSPEELATSLYHVESTGLRSKDALEAVTVASEGAAVGNANLEETTNALTATIASGMLPATETYAEAMGQLNTIVGSGDMKLQDLNDALGTGLLATVKQYGVSLTDVGAALADFGDNNIRGADAATLTRMAVQAISKPSVTAAGDLRTIGLTVEQLQSDQQTGGLNKALTDLHSHLVSSGIESQKWGGLLVDAFTKKAGGGIITLIGTYDRFEQKYKEVGEAGAKFGDAWAATQKSAAFQTKALEDKVLSLTTSFGEHMLPVVTSGLTWINHDGIPAIEHLASGVGDAVHWFLQLPAPVKEAAIALGILKVLGSSDMFAGMILSGRVLAFGFAMDMRNMVTTARAGAGQMTAAFAEAKAAQQALVMQRFGTSTVARATGDVAGLSAAAGVAARTGLSALKSGLGGVVNLLGGPWAVAIAGGVSGLLLFNNIMEAHDKAVKADTESVRSWYEAMNTKGGKSGLDALNNLRSKTQELADAQAKLNEIESQHGEIQNRSRAGAGAENGVLIAQRQKVADLTAELAKGKKEWEDTEATMGASEVAQLKLTAATNTLEDALASHDPRRIAIAQKEYTDAVNGSNDATNRLTRAQVLIAAGAPVAAKSLALIGDISMMNTDQIKAAQQALDEQVKGLMKVSDAFIDPLKSYQDMAQKMAQATADSTKSSKDSWSDYINTVHVDLGKYAADLETQIKNEENWQTNLVLIAKRGGEGVAQQLADMGVAGAGLTAQMAHATGANFDRMAKDLTAKAALGGAGAAKALQEGMAVAAAAGAAGAKATVQGIAAQLGLGVDVVRAIAAQYGLKLAEGVDPILHALGRPNIANVGYAAGSRHGGFAGGGYTGDGGKYEAKGIVHGGEFVFTKEQTANAGVDRLYSLASMLSGYSGGGYVSASDVPRPPSLVPYQVPISTAGSAAMGTEYDAVTKWLTANVNIPSMGAVSGALAQQALQLGARMAAARGWVGPQWSALEALWKRESGWNPDAVNPSSGAYGIPQALGHGHPFNLGDSAAQISWGLDYLGGRYGTPIGAWAHEQKFGWYHDGGKVTGGPAGATVPAFLKVDERVLTAPQDDYFRRRVELDEARDRRGGLPASLAGFANYGTIHTDPETLARKSSQGTRRVLATVLAR